MQFKAFEPGIEVWGVLLQWAVAGFRILPETGMRYLARHGLIIPGVDGKLRLDINAWYPLETWLACFEAITREVGANVVIDIGRTLGATGELPPHIKDLDQAMAWLDIAYHQHHKKRGKLMYDQATGRMLEGIGHYSTQRVPGEQKIISRCENPYSCDFDLGVLIGYANRFNPRSRVNHDTTAPCRKSGESSCTYVLTW
jgi:hypothetical protein